MKKRLLLLMTLFIMVGITNAQTVLDNWEAAPAGIRLDYYTGNDGNYGISVSNPSKFGINTSDGVAQYIRKEGVAPLDSQFLGSAPLGWGSFDLNANKVFSVDVLSQNAFKLVLLVKDDNGAGGGPRLGFVTQNYTNPLYWQKLVFDFTSYIASYGTTPTGDFQVLFYFEPGSEDGTPFEEDFYFDNFIGYSDLDQVTSIKNASSLSDSKIFPNPVSDFANIELNLKSSSDVKITMNDMLGREIAVIAEGNMASYNGQVDVSSFEKGTYILSYLINGEPTKTELMIVK